MRLEFEDISSVTEETDSASVHGIVTKGSNYFNATVSEFKDSQQNKLKEAMETIT